MWRNKINNFMLKSSRLAVDSQDSFSAITVAPYDAYSHSTKVLREASTKDVNSFIAMEKSRVNDSQVVLYDVVQQNDNHYVHLFYLDLAWVEAHGAKSLFVVPITWLVYQSAPQNSVTVIDNVFVASLPNGPLAISRSPVLNSPELFAEANGIASTNINQQAKSWEQWAEQGLTDLRRYPIKGFFNPLIGRKLQDYDYRPSILAVILVLGVYLGLSSAFLLWKVDSVSADIARLSPQVSDVIAATSSTERSVSTVADLQQLIASRRFYLPVWSALSPVYEAGATVKSVRTDENGNLEVGLQGKSASELVSLIGQHPLVHAISLKGEVRSYRGDERFVVNIELQQEPVNDA